MRLAAYQNVFLLAAALAPALPPPAAAAWLALVLAAWWGSRPSRRELWLAAPILAVAAGLFLFKGLAGGGEAPNASELATQVEAAWQDLEEAAQAGRASFDLAPEALADEREAFRTLERLADRWGAGVTWHLVDADGMAFAWAGPGLLHDLPSAASFSGSRSSRSSFISVTLLAEQALPAGESGSPLRVVAGRSFPADRAPGGQEATLRRWAVAGAGEGGSEAGIAIGGGGGGETDAFLVLAPATSAAVRPGGAHLAGVLVGVALLLIGLLRFSLTNGKRSGGVLEAAVWLAPLVAGSALAAASLGAERWAVALLTIGMAAALLARSTRLEALRPLVEIAAGLLITAALLAAGKALQGTGGSLDLGAHLVGSGHLVTVRVAFFFLALAFLQWLPLGKWGPRRSLWAWISLAALAVGAAFHAQALVGAVSLTAAAVAACLWWRGGDKSWRWAETAVRCLIAAMLAALAWEVAFHGALERELETDLLPRLAAPTGEELAAAASELREHFDGTHVLSSMSLSASSASSAADTSASVGPDGEASGDLAYALWRASPLALGGRLSALYIEPPEGPGNGFSFGLRLGEDGDLDRTPPVFDELFLPGWEEALVGGESVVEGLTGEPVTLRYWVLLRPGFRGRGEPIDRVAEGLLRGGPAGALGEELLPRGVQLGLYAADGSVLVSPWKGAPDIDGDAGPQAIEPTRGARAKTLSARDEAGWRVLYLTILPPLLGLERVSTHAVSPLLVLAMAFVTAFVINLGRREWSERLQRSWRSYSRRLLILYTAILVVPIVLGNVLLLRVISDRLEAEDRAAGEAALESAQRILGEYVLALEPGFGVETALDDQLLLWLSRVLHHEVNLYWGSDVYASSKPELFRAGLLPERIPGEIYKRLALEGSNLSSRMSRAGGSIYQEFYAPLKVPGVPTERPNLFLSTPLLAQEVERAEQLAAIRRRIVLVASGLVMLLAALGHRLARRFTEPLMDLVEATQRIAQGARSIDLKPRETELATLAEAIDQMARKIARGRERLLAEKKVVDSVVENITSGVVSLDREGRVLLLNRNARDLLGLEVGESLREQLGGAHRLRPVAEFLERAAAVPAQTTVSIRDAVGDRGGDGDGDGDGHGDGDADADESEWTVIWVPLPGSSAPAAILVLEDVTEVLRGQRLEAWAEMARMIAHEIKNPLTPIRLSTEHLREVHARRRDQLDEVFERCTDNILEQVQELQEISSEFSIYSRIPRADLKPGDLAAAVGRVVGAYRSGPPEGVRVDWSPPEESVPARFDEKLLARAVRNLLENAVRAVSNGGSVDVSLDVTNGKAELRVADTGPGVEPASLGRIFEPYFSTDDSGTGLGLPIARKIVEEHGGAIHARNRPERGLEVILTLPTLPSAASS